MQTFLVLTKKLGIVLGSCWDLDHVIETKKWSLINLTDNEIASLPHSDYLADKDSEPSSFGKTLIKSGILLLIFLPH
jgi:hypothetical protein